MRREKWLVLSNCQTSGLAASLESLCPTIDVARAWLHETDVATADLAGYDRLLVHEDFAPRVADRPELAQRVIAIPGLRFGGYHPDIGYFNVMAANAKTLLKGPMLDYHSMIAVACYVGGSGPAAAAEWIRSGDMETLGLLDVWNEDKAQLQLSFARCGLELLDFLPRWAACDSFMHSVNHPKIECLSDVVRAIADRQGVPILDSHRHPIDELLRLPVYPVYPQIAERLLVNGSLAFNSRPGTRCLNLDAFIEQSFEIYGRYPAEAISPFPQFANRFERIVDAVRTH